MYARDSSDNTEYSEALPCVTCIFVKGNLVILSCILVSLYRVTYIFVSIAGEVDGGSFILHVDRDPADLRQHVLEVPEVCQEIHDGVSNLKEHWFTIPNAD